MRGGRLFEDEERLFPIQISIRFFLCVRIEFSTRIRPLDYGGLSRNNDCINMFPFRKRTFLGIVSFFHGARSSSGISRNTMIGYQKTIRILASPVGNQTGNFQLFFIF